jgi:glutathione S-transferase
MLELIQFPWSPYCLVLRRILQYSGAPSRIVDIPSTDRSLVWKLSRKRYYQVPVLKDGRNVIFETEENSQVIAKYLESKLNLGLFPRSWDGIQKILWRYIENDVEGVTFRLNDAYFREFVPAAEQWAYVRHKERKFGKGCLDQWFQQQKQLVAELNEKLVPFEQMLGDRSFLLDNQPRFVDFDLWGMLANFLFSGHYKLPSSHARLKSWYERVGKAKFVESSREKLHS